MLNRIAMLLWGVVVVSTVATLVLLVIWNRTVVEIDDDVVTPDGKRFTIVRSNKPRLGYFLHLRDENGKFVTSIPITDHDEWDMWTDMEPGAYELHLTDTDIYVLVAWGNGQVDSESTSVVLKIRLSDGQVLVDNDERYIQW